MVVGVAASDEGEHDEELEGQRGNMLSPTKEDRVATIVIFALVGLSQVIIYSYVSLLSPFFPDYARDHYHASSLEIGLVFSFYSLAQVMFSPWSSSLCRRFGRLAILYAGLLVFALSTIMFAEAKDIKSSMVARSVQGVGGAMVNVAGYALVFRTSDNVARDVGILELLTGLAFTLGPPLGAFLYTWLDVEPMFLCLSVVPVANLCLFMVAVKLIHLPKGIHEGAPPESSGTCVLVRNRTVILVSLALIVDAAALGFLDPTLAWHLNAVLGLGVEGVGIIMAITPLVYSVLALLVGQKAGREGLTYVITTGLALVAICFFFLGPIPLLSFLPFSRTMAWIVVMSSLVGMGLGTALIVVPAVPLMLQKLEHDPDCEGDVNDPVSAIYMAAWSLGDFIGPSIGGAFTEYLPATKEIACEGGDPNCLSPFPWASTLYGTLVLLTSVAFLIGTTSDRIPPHSSNHHKMGRKNTSPYQNGQINQDYEGNGKRGEKEPLIVTTNGGGVSGVGAPSYSSF